MFLSFSLCLLLPGGAWAQTPEMPCLEVIPPFTQWMVQISPAAVASGVPLSPEQNEANQLRERYFPPLESIAGSKDENVIREVSTWKGGVKTLAFVVEGILYRSSTPLHPDDIVVLHPATQGNPDYTKCDFPDLAWVSPNNFVKTERKEGKLCHYYELATDGHAPSQKVWIDAGTKLPFLYDNGQSVFRYTFSAAGREPIAIPPAFQKLIAPARLTR